MRAETTDLSTLTDIVMAELESAVGAEIFNNKASPLSEEAYQTIKETLRSYAGAVPYETFDVGDTDEYGPDRMQKWYPDGSITSEDQWTVDLKYTEPDIRGNVMVKSFCNTGDSDNDNSDKEVVVVPPYTVINGMKHNVVGIASGVSNDENGNLTSITVPTTVKTINDGAFLRCSDLTAISFPAVANIGASAFYACYELHSIHFPATTNVGDEAFLECNELESASFPAATDIGKGAFYNCKALSTVSFNSVINIGSYAFGDCDVLTSIHLPAATTIGTFAFSNCTALTSVSIPAATTIQSGAFSDCTALTNVYFPAAITLDDAFNRCTALTSVSLPAATTLGPYVFFRCTALTSVSLPAATSIGEYTFSECSSMVSISIPFVRNIGDKAFFICEELTTLELSSFTKEEILANASDWGIKPLSGHTITITASDETFAITGD